MFTRITPLPCRVDLYKIYCELIDLTLIGDELPRLMFGLDLHFTIAFNHLESVIDPDLFVLILKHL